MNDIESANVVYKKHFPHSIKIDLTNSPGGISVSTTMLAKADALQKKLKDNTLPNAEKNEIRRTIDFYRNAARNAKMME